MAEAQPLTGGVPEQVTLRLSPEARQSLEWIMAQSGQRSLGEVIRHALSMEKYLLEQKAGGANVLIEDRKGNLRQVVLP